MKFPSDLKFAKGDRVKIKIDTELVAGDWDPVALESRVDGSTGTMHHWHDSHGLSYEVLHDAKFGGHIGHYEGHEIVHLISEAERSLRFIRWQIAYRVLNTRDIEADQMTKNGLIHLSTEFLIIINMCNKGLCLPMVDETTVQSEEYLISILNEGQPET